MKRETAGSTWKPCRGRIRSSLETQTITKVINRQFESDSRDRRNDSVVKSACFNRGPKWGSEHPSQMAHSHLQCQLKGIWHPLWPLRVSTCMHVHIQTQTGTHTQNKILKMILAMKTSKDTLYSSFRAFFLGMPFSWKSKDDNYDWNISSKNAGCRAQPQKPAYCLHVLLAAVQKSDWADNLPVTLSLSTPSL